MKIVDRFRSNNRKRIVERVLSGDVTVVNVLESEDWASLPDILSYMLQQTREASQSLLKYPVPKIYQDPEKLVALGRMNKDHLDRLKELGPGVYVPLAGVLTHEDMDIGKEAAHMLRLLLAGEQQELPAEVISLLGHAAGHADPSICSEACQALQSLQTRDIDVATALPGLLTALSTTIDKEHTTRLLSLVGELGTRANSASASLAVLLESSDTLVRTAAIRALVRIDPEGALQPLIKVLDDESWNVRESAIRALGQIDDPQVADALIIALDDKHVSVRHAAVIMLAKVGNPKAARFLLAILHDESEAVRQAVVTTLDILGWQPDEGVDGGAYWASKRKWGKCIAIGVPAVGSLLQVATLGSDTRLPAGEALVEIGEPAIEPLVAALRGQVATVRAFAAETVVKLLGTDAADLLIEALKDENEEVRQAVMCALEQIDDERAIDTFISALGDEHVFVRQAMAYMLGRIDSERAIQPLVAALNDAHADVRLSIAMALDQLEWEPDLSAHAAIYWLTKRKWDKCAGIGAAAVEPLMLAAELGEVERQAAISIFKQIGVPAMQPLILALDNDNPFVRLVAAEALMQVGSERVVEPLLQMLRSKDLFTPKAKRQLDAQRNDVALTVRMVETLLCALAYSDISVSRTAADALANMTDENLGEDVARWEQWWETELLNDEYDSIVAADLKRSALSESRRVLVNTMKLANNKKQIESALDKAHEEVVTRRQDAQNSGDTSPLDPNAVFEQITLQKSDADIIRLERQLQSLKPKLHQAQYELKAVLVKSMDDSFITRASAVLLEL